MDAAFPKDILGRFNVLVVLLKVLMILEIIIVIAIVVIVLLIPELVKPVPQVGTLEGTVSYGGDVSGVTITLEQSGSVVASATTDEQGAFAFDGEFAIGEYTIKARKDVPEGTLTADEFITIVGGDNLLADLPLVR